jgi:hypothetical protein
MISLNLYFHSVLALLQVAPVDPVVEKYISMGLGREAVSFAVLNYGDNPTKACSFPLFILYFSNAIFHHHQFKN